MLYCSLSALILLVFIYPTNCLNSDNFECLQQGPCYCEYPNHWSIDLTQIGKSVTYLVAANSSIVYFYVPCNEIKLSASNAPNETALLWRFNATEAASGILNATLVLSGGVNGSYATVANNKTVEFQSTEFHVNQAFIQYTKPGEQTILKLKCQEDGPTELKLGEPVEGYVNSLMLISPEVCPKSPLSTTSGISAGSVLLLIFFSFALVYFAGGALALKYFRGAEGLEMIPNYDFWRELPSLVKDGLIFVLTCGQTRPDSYERI